MRKDRAPVRARPHLLAGWALLLWGATAGLAGGAEAPCAAREAAAAETALPRVPSPLAVEARALAAVRPLSLAAGGFPVPRAAGATARSGELPQAAARRLAALPLSSRSDAMAAARGFDSRTSPPDDGGEVRPKAQGDRLIVSLDDGFAIPVEAAYEARFDVTGAVAGPQDAVAARFPLRAVAALPPLRVTDVILGLENLRGARVFPAVEVWAEDPGFPLQPRRGALSAMVASFDAVAAGLAPAPPGSLAPTAFARLPVGLPALDIPVIWLGDGSFDDAFDRADEPLDNLGGDWLECANGACGGVVPRRLQVLGNVAVRPTSGVATLGVKFQEAGVFGVRPAQDIDLDASVTVDLSAGSATRAGLAVRAAAPDAFYRVEFVKTPRSVEVHAVTPGGAVPLGAPLAAPAAGTSAVLRVRATGASPSVTLDVFVDGAPVGSVTDSTARIAGSLVGLSASSPASAGEAWDDFQVERRGDLMVVVGLPPGEDAALPLDVSEGAVISNAALVSSDGTAFAPRGATAGCFNPGNPFIQLEVEDTTAADPNLFEVGAHVVSLDVACPTCPTRRNPCTESRSEDELRAPVLTVGETFDVTASWWNEHLDDADRLLLRASLWDAPCQSVAGALVTSGDVVVGPDTGQRAGGPALRSAGVLSFSPTVAGSYCLVVEELHDLNADCCPDGAETAPFPGLGCPLICTPAPASDANVTDSLVLRDLRIEDPCVPNAMSNLAGDSLRVSRTQGERVVTRLTWGRVDANQFWSQYNVHSMVGEAIRAGQTYRDFAPVVARPIGAPGVLDLDLTPPAGARPLWFAIFEADGCPSGNSIPP